MMVKKEVDHAIVLAKSAEYLQALTLFLETYGTRRRSVLRKTPRDSRTSVSASLS